MRAIILAGGLGTRLRDTVPNLPKPMAPVKGRPFLEHLMDYWRGQGVCEFILSVGHRRETIMAHFGAEYQDVPIRYAVEEAPLGTGGGLLLAAAMLPKNEPFLLLNGDTFFAVPLHALADFHRDHNSCWTFSLFTSNEIGRYMGMEIAPDGRILALQSKSVSALVNGGVYLVAPEIVEQTGCMAGSQCSLENDMLPALIRRGAALYGMEAAGRFIDIGIAADYARAGEVIA